MGRSLALTLLVMLSACEDSYFKCARDSECTLGDTPGFCEATNRCSVAAPECESNRRYGDYAGDLSNECIDGIVLDVHASPGGRVTSLPPGIDCDGSEASRCSVVFASDETVALSVEREPNMYVSWKETCADGDVDCARVDECLGTETECLVPMDKHRVVNATFRRANYVFLTSTKQAPTPPDVTGPNLFSGAQGADAICAQRAQAAGLAGTYVAWVATSTESAPTRLRNANPSVRGWIRVDGKPVAGTMADLTGGRMLYPIRITELETDVGSDDEVATGTDSGGGWYSSAKDPIYGDWTAGNYGTGRASAERSVWTTAGNGNGPARLYCFGVDFNDDVTFVPSQGRNAFVTSTPFDVGTGLAGANAMCQSLATSRSLPGTYRALLATAGHAAIEPFDIDPSKRPWIRMDGVPLSATASDFADGKLLAALDVQQDGATYSVFRVWTGAATTGEPGTATCGDWTNTMDASGTRSGHSPATSSTFFNQMAATCGATMTLHLYCLEE